MFTTPVPVNVVNIAREVHGNVHAREALKTEGPWPSREHVNVAAGRWQAGATDTPSDRPPDAVAGSG